jgi:hypothetical protein
MAGVLCLNSEKEENNMGGGGGIGPFYGSGASIDKLRNAAREELKKPAPTEARKRVFISFVREDLDLVNLFRGQAKNENSDLDFIDYSLRVPFDSKNAEYIKRGIMERINQSSVTVVLITNETHKSNWVDWEIRESIRLGKGVVAVKLKDTPMKMPAALEEHGIRPVGWDQKLIRQAIDTAAENR